MAISREKKYVIACLEEEIYSPVSYIRLVHHLQRLKTLFRISVLVMPRQLNEALAGIPEASLLLMARNRNEASYAVAQKAAQHGVPILCDIDDYIWRFPDYSKVIRYDAIHTDDILSLASCITTPSERIAQLVGEKHPNKDIRCIPNAGNIWSGDGKHFVPCVTSNSDFFRVPEMKAEFFRALNDAAGEAGKTLLLSYFSNDPPEHYTDEPHLRVIWFGFRSYSSYKQLLDHIKPEFAFVPLRDEEFSRYKSVVKFAEYGYAGTIGIYSRVEPYAGFISDGTSGFLADNTYESWKSSVLKALTLSAEAKVRIREEIAGIVRESFDFKVLHDKFRSLLLEYAVDRRRGDDTEAEIPDLREFTFKEAYFITALQAAYDQLSRHSSTLQADYDALLKHSNDLQGLYDTLAKHSRDLQAAYNSLAGHSKGVQATCDALEERVRRLDQG